MKTLFIDIETRPALAYVWGSYRQNISPEQIVEPTALLCFAASWDGKKIIFRSAWDDGVPQMVRSARKLLNEADAVVHYYGSSFDVPMLNNEFILRKIAPPAPFHQIDLKKVVSRVMRLTSNRLAFVAPYLKIGEKVKHEGFALWRGVLEGDKAAQARMKRYNIQDTRLLQPLYTRLLPWIDQHPNVGMFTGNAQELVCTRCGSAKLRSNGLRRATTYTYRRYQCLDCGGWMRWRLSTKIAGGPAVLRPL